MMSRTVTALVTATLAVGMLGHAVAQSAVTTDLGKRTGKSKYALGSLYAMRELADGRVVAVDLKEGVFRLIDFNRGDVSLLGTQGDDDGNYRRASGLLDLPGDSLGLVDATGPRMLHLSSAGAFGAMTPLPGASQKLFAFATDQQGNAYFRATVRDSAGLPSAQSWITRLSPTDEAPVQLVPYRTRAADQTGAGLMPFRFTDAIAIRRDGLVARVVADTFQVIWYRDGKEAGRSGRIPYEPIVISDAEKQAMQDSVVQAFKGLTAGRGGANPNGGQTFTLGGPAGGGGGDGNRVVIMNGSGGDLSATVGALSGARSATTSAGGSAGGGVVQMANFDPTKLLGVFPATKPPIPNGSNVAMFDAEGHLWVARSKVRGDLLSHYDVIDQQRGVIGHVTLPQGTRLVGFGKGVAYLARADEGSDWLERYATPKM